MTNHIPSEEVWGGYRYLHFMIPVIDIYRDEDRVQVNVEQKDVRGNNGEDVEGNNV